MLRSPLRQLSLVAVAGTAAALLAGCSSAPAPSVASDPVRASAPTPVAGEVTFYLGLPYDSEGLGRAVQAAADPTSSTYRVFRTVEETAARFGGTDAQLGAIVSSVKALGLSVDVDPSHVFARLRATPDQWAKVLGASMGVTAATSSSPFTTYSLPSRVPSALEPQGTALLTGISQVYDAAADTVTRRTGAQADVAAPAPQQWPTNTGTPYEASCSAPILQDRAVMTPAQVATAYGVDQLRQSTGGGTPVVTILDIGGGWSQKDLTLASECFGYKAPTIRQTQGDGVASAIAQANDETTLDVQTVAAVASSAEIRLVQTVSGTGAFLDGFSRAIATSPVPDVVSVSYGACAIAERQGLPAYANAINAVIGTAATIGVGVYIAAGDSGSTTCGTQVKGPSLSFPAVSPYVTAVGGTRLFLGSGNAITSEVVWNDSVYGQAGAGGGGRSVKVETPWFQEGRTGQARRTLPDVSALAAISPGWPIVLDSSLTTVGGTSGATPFTAAAASILSAHERAAGRPAIGLAVGWFYAADASAFRDITSGDNDLEGVGCCTAAKGYDQASGLGSPDWSKLPATLPAPRG